MIADFEVTEAMLRQFIDKVLHSRFSRPRLIMCAPSGITDVERRAVEEASLSAGAREVHLIEESLAAAIGAGLPIAEPVGRMVVDVGGGTSEVAVISLGGIVVAARCASAATTSTTRSPTTCGSSTGWRSAPRAPRRSSWRSAPRRRSSEELSTRSAAATCCPACRASSSSTARRSAARSSRRSADIMAAVHATLEETPPELAADIARQGIVLAGGGALLRGFAERVHRETGMPVHLADDPLTCVASAPASRSRSSTPSAAVAGVA